MEETKRDLAEARKEVRAGKTKSFSQVKREPGFLNACLFFFALKALKEFRENGEEGYRIETSAYRAIMH